MAKTKPSYLGLLNALAVGESAAEPLFNSWAENTTDKRLAKTLRFVAMREGEHGMAFKKRMLELGYEVREPEEDPVADSMKIVESSKTDGQKFRALKFHKGQAPTDFFDTIFQDKTIDPVTGALLGRYIAEERDSVRMLSEEYARVNAREKAAAARKKARAAAKTAKTK